MVEVTQLSFTWVEIAEMLVKKADIHEGKWLVTAEMSINAGILGATPTDSKPGVVVLLNRLQLVKAETGAPESLVVDAAKLNPVPAS
jgi:hypothetical protein